MKCFDVTGYLKYKNIHTTVHAEDQKNALIQVLASNNIPYSNILKLTAAENEKLLDQGIVPFTYIDFTVANSDSWFSPTGTGNWHIVV